MKIHQAKKCLKKKQCRSQDHKTCIRPTQDANHSGQVTVTAETSVKSPVKSEVAERKPKVAWPAAKDKASYRNFEEKVCKNIYRMKGSVQERLKKLANTIYEEGIATFGEVPVKQKKEEAKRPNKQGESRRERKMRQLRQEKKTLRKRWMEARPDEKEGLKILYDDLKKKCRDTERNLRRIERQKESRRTRD